MSKKIQTSVQLLEAIKEESSSYITQYNSNVYHAEILAHHVVSNKQAQLELCTKVAPYCKADEYQALQQLILTGESLACQWLEIKRSLPSEEDFLDDEEDEEEKPMVITESSSLADRFYAPVVKWQQEENKRKSKQEFEAYMQARKENDEGVGTWQYFKLYGLNANSQPFYAFSKRYRWYMGDNHEGGELTSFCFIELERKDKESSS